MSNWQQQLYDDVMKRRSQQAAPQSSPKSKQVIRQSKKEPNKTERRFELEYLKAWLIEGKIDRYGSHESIQIEIANGARFRPDWPTWKDGRLTFYEVKGKKIWDDAKDRLKIAARSYPEFKFYVCQWNGCEWIIQEVLA